MDGSIQRSVRRSLRTNAASRLDDSGDRSVAKRLSDVVLAVVLLVALAPLLAVLALTIKLESPGPVMYRCRRVGRSGREFMMLKLRKMHRDASGSPLTSLNDAR